MADNKAPPMAFWVVVGLLFGGCCVFTALVAVVAPNAEGWAQRQTFEAAMRANMDLPAADEERLARLAYEAMMATGGMRAFDSGRAADVGEGARRVDDRVIVELHELRTTLARASLPFCASLWSGEDNSTELYPLLARQSDDVVLSFFRVTYHLLDAAIEGGPVAMTEDEIATETDAAFEGASLAHDPSAIAIALELDLDADPTQQCAALLELHDFIRAQPEPTRSRYARALFASMSAPL